MNQDLCLSRKKTANMAAILASPPEARAKAGATGELVFPGGIYIQRKMITVHWGDVCVFWFLYLYIYIYIYCVYIYYT